MKIDVSLSHANVGYKLNFPYKSSELIFENVEYEKKSLFE